MIDDWLDKYDLFKGRACFAGVIKAVLELGKWAGQHSRSDANGITGILGSPLCGGNQVTIVGAGFGSIKTPIVSCPPCLPAGKNRISVAGPPAIHTFRFTPSQVAPGGQPVLSWNVANATSVQMVGVSGNGPALALPSPLPTAGSITLAPVGGLVPVSGRYRLTASNGCGTKVADAEFTMTRTPTLSILRIEAVQGIQKVDNSVRLTANRRTAVRVFVDSGITDGFNLGVGANRVGGMVGTVYAENVTTGAAWNCGPAWPVNSQASPMPDRDLLGDSLNFDVPLAACNGTVRLRAVIELPGAIGQPPLSWSTSSIIVSFTPKPPQEILPILITDPASTSPPPTMADLFTNLSGPAGAHPFPENGFALNPPLMWTLGPLENLKVGIAWSILIAKIAATFFIFSPTAVGGIRTGVVPNDPLYPWGGMALPRLGLTAPSFISVAGNPGTCTHELGHAYGLLHANSCGPAGPYGALPLTISDPGLDVARRAIVPAGTAEMMTYCQPQWPSVEHWDYIFDRIAIS